MPKAFQELAVHAALVQAEAHGKQNPRKKHVGHIKNKKRMYIAQKYFPYLIGLLNMYYSLTTITHSGFKKKVHV